VITPTEPPELTPEVARILLRIIMSASVAKSESDMKADPERPD
jgi:hypothetical protein